LLLFWLDASKGLSYTPAPNEQRAAETAKVIAALEPWTQARRLCYEAAAA